MRRSWVRVLTLLVIGTAALTSSAQNSPPDKYQPTEVDVKAAFLYHFAQLVTWPETEEGDPTAPLVIGVLGHDPFGDRLDATIGGETIRGRPVKIVRLGSVSELASPPQILFVGSVDRDEVNRCLSAVAKAPVLTVSSAAGFARRGGMIEFRLTPDRRVAFDINVQAATAVGLKMSSQLLKVARIVEGPK